MHVPLSGIHRRSLYKNRTFQAGRLNIVQLMSVVLGSLNITNNEVYLRNEIEEIG